MTDESHSEAKTPGGISQPGRRIFRILASAFGMIALLCSWWSCLLIMFMAGKNIVIMANVDGYRPAVFTIEELVYAKGIDRHGYARGDRFWAEGTVNGQAEEFTFGAYLKTTPRSQEELEKAFSVGQQLKVLYNPDVSGDVDARVLYPREDFQEYWKDRWRWLLKQAYLPLGISLALSIVFSVAARTWTSLKFIVAALLFTLFGWFAILPGVMS